MSLQSCCAMTHLHPVSHTSSLEYHKVLGHTGLPTSTGRGCHGATLHQFLLCPAGHSGSISVLSASMSISCGVIGWILNDSIIKESAVCSLVRGHIFQVVAKGITYIVHFIAGCYL